MAPDSKIVFFVFKSLKTGILLNGLIFENLGLNWSPFNILILVTLYFRFNSSNKIDTFFPLGVSALKSSNIILYPILFKGIYSRKII